LHFGEGSSRLGYIPRTNWTRVLCDGLTSLLESSGVNLRRGATIRRLHARRDRIVEAELEGGERTGADCFVSTLPTEIYRDLVADDGTPYLGSIRYTAVISLVCATRRRVEPDFYWMNLASPACAASGLFRLDSLNPTIGAPDEACLNFVTHLPHRGHEMFGMSDGELLRAYSDDFRRIFGHELTPDWTHLARLPMYSPTFLSGYRNPPVRSSSWRNVYFAGNYRTFPSIASTGTALWSGLEAADASLRDHGATTDLPALASAFRPRR
jgi:hypothetical protein